MKIISTPEAAKLIHDQDVVFLAGFGQAGFPDEVCMGIEQSFLETGSPKNLTIYHGAGIGNCKDRGIGHLAHEGLLKRLIGGHFGIGGPAINTLIVENRIEAYNFPQGVLSLMPRNMAGHRPGMISKVGIGTFVDPRNEGGKITTKTTEDLVRSLKLTVKNGFIIWLPS
jgi:propionate CoA-transferase